jgi:acyl-CoA thioester hydrolase
MPLTHVRTYRVRQCECDVRGNIYHANYLRYMQEAAFDASAAAGYDLARYDEIGYLWLTRETQIEVTRQLHYNDSVQVKTWVADFRRVRSRRAYELRLSSSGELVAEAWTDWAFLDQATQRPARIPMEMKAAFFPEGLPDPAPARERFPSPPPPPPSVFRSWRRVEWRDLDAAGHVNNAVYLAYIEESAIQAARAHGWPPARMDGAGFVPVARRHRIEYRLPALLDDELEISTWLSDVTSTTAIRHYRLRRLGDDALLAQARTVWGTVDLVTGESIALPEAFLSALEPNRVKKRPGADHE